MSNNKTTKKDDEFVSVQKFEQLEKSVEALAGSINTLVDSITKKNDNESVSDTKEDVKTEESDETAPAKATAMPLPPEWREIVDSVLGKDFGIDVNFPKSGKGFEFKILVPLDKSNAPQDHLDFYKVDARTKAISYSDGLEGVKLFCEKVAKNLGIKT